jgi:hypothetical protein
MNDAMRCGHCGDVIGVYEPLVEFVDGRARETSLGAEPFSDWTEGSCFHRDCFRELHDGDVEVDA